MCILFVSGFDVGMSKMCASLCDCVRYMACSKRAVCIMLFVARGWQVHKYVLLAVLVFSMLAGSIRCVLQCVSVLFEVGIANAELFQCAFSGLACDKQWFQGVLCFRGWHVAKRGCAFSMCVCASAQLCNCTLVHVQNCT